MNMGVFGTVLTLAVSTLALSAHAKEVFTGRATTYGLIDAIGGSCSVRKSPLGVDPSLFVAMNGDQYDSSSSCSRCLSITGPKGTILTYVADICFECGHGNLDFNTALWNTLIGGDPRIEGISWFFTPCPDEQEKFCMKEGSNPQWLALQVANSRDGIKSMEIGGVKANVIGITSFYQATSSQGFDINNLDVKITSNSGIPSKVKLTPKSYDGCAMPSGNDNAQSNDNNNNNPPTTVVVDLTGVTQDLSAWRSYRRRHHKVY